MKKHIVAFCSLCLLLCSTAWAQDFAVKRADTSDWPTIRILAELPGTAAQANAYTLRLLSPERTLTASSIRAIEGTAGPATLVVALDTSRSLSPEHLEAAKNALTRYMDELDREERVALLSFDDRVDQVNGFTADRDAFADGLAKLRLEGNNTTLYRAMLAGIDMLKDVPGQRTLLVITDGKNEDPGVTREQVAQAAQDARVRIAVIGLPTLQESESARYLPLMQDFARETGGIYRPAATASELNAACYEVLMDQRGKGASLYELTFNAADALPLENAPNPVPAMLLYGPAGNSHQAELSLNVPAAARPDVTREVTPVAAPAERMAASSTNATVAAPVVTDVDAHKGFNMARHWWWLLAALLLLLLLWNMFRRKSNVAPDAVTDREVYVIDFPELKRTFRLRPGTMIMGSSAASDIIVDDPSISDVHAEFCVDAECRVRDMHSSQGILLNGKPVTESTALKPGDVLQFGTTRAVIRRAQDAPHYTGTNLRP